MAEKRPPRKTSAPKPAGDDDQAARDAQFPVVGVGASAGGVEACRALMQALPADTGMAFVFVLHLSPTHRSMLPEILARDGRVSMTEVKDDCPLEPNHFYVIPAGMDITVADGHLKLAPQPEARGHPRTIDTFFRSLARERGHKAVGVVLSGTSADGTLGLQEIKAVGGITFAQDGTALHDSMPRNAIAAGCVDYVLPPDGIGAELARIAHHPYVAPPAQPAEGRLELEAVLDLLYQATGVDFHHYKPNTLQRRIARRMLLHRINDVQRYAELLKRDPGEVESLYQDVLIGVTSFFRNPECFEALKEKVFPQLTNERSRHDPVRVWVLGCSTGEEAYSIAIVLAEYLEAQGRQLPVQVFATDVNGAAIERARNGVYPATIAQDVAPQRLRRYFTESDGGYRINKSIRDICVFARHNVLSEPPFSRIDLVTCRNLLIYLGAEMQQRVMPILHFALKHNGFMLLGASETVGTYRDRFELEDAKHKIYRKKDGANREVVVPMPQSYSRPDADRAPGGEARAGRDAGALDVYKEADRILLSKYAPPSVLVNGEFDILQFRGNTGLYLSPAPGKASLNLLKMLREGLLVAVRGALYRAKKEEVVVREEGLRVRSNGGYRQVSVEVMPMKLGAGASATCYMVLFDDADHGREAHEPPEPVASTPAAEGAEAEITRLKQELNATREYLQAVIEQQEAANEEVQSANEEVQSANEELQSINEELETSKEELQSSNEELATVNEELHNRNMELGQSNNDLMNLLSSVQLAIVMLSPSLTIRRFTPHAEKLLRLIPADVGRPIKDLNLNVTIPELESHLEEVIDSVSVKEFEVRDNDGHWYSLRLRPYRTLENRIDGAVLVLVDIDALKRSQELLRQHTELLRQHTELLNQAYEPIIMWEVNAGITYWNRAATETYGYTADHAMGRAPHELLATTPPLSAYLDALMRDGRWAGELTHTRRNGETIRVESRMSLVREAGGRTVVVEASRAALRPAEGNGSAA